LYRLRSTRICAFNWLQSSSSEGRVILLTGLGVGVGSAGTDAQPVRIAMSMRLLSTTNVPAHPLRARTGVIGVEVLGTTG
jgi:hypothetical protein